MASLMCSRKLSVSCLYWTQDQVNVQDGSAQLSDGDSNSPILAVPKKAVRLAAQTDWVAGLSQPDVASLWPRCFRRWTVITRRQFGFFCGADICRFSAPLMMALVTSSSTTWLGKPFSLCRHASAEV